jgi:hypothetical protein
VQASTDFFRANRSIRRQPTASTPLLTLVSVLDCESRITTHILPQKPAVNWFEIISEI